MIERRSALAHHPKMMTESIGLTGDADPARLVLSERHGLTVLQVTAFASELAQATAALTNALGLSAPACNRISGSAEKSLRHVGPGVWLLVGESAALPPPPSTCRQGSLCNLTLQSCPYWGSICPADSCCMSTMRWRRWMLNIYPRRTRHSLQAHHGRSRRDTCPADTRGIC